MPQQERIRVGVPLSPQTMNDIGELDQFPQSSKQYDPQKEWSLTYRVWGCHGYKKHPNSQNKEMGLLKLSKSKVTDRQFHLDIHQEIVNDYGLLNRIKASVECQNNEFKSPVSWQLTSEFIGSEGQTLTELGTHETGRIDKESLIIKAQGKPFTRSIQLPLSSDWSLLEAVHHFSFDHDFALDFHLLEGLSVFKPHQTLVYKGKIEQSINDRILTLHRFDHTGPGNLPWEYWLDDQHRLLAVISMNKTYWLDDNAVETAKMAFATQIERHERRKQ